MFDADDDDDLIGNVSSSPGEVKRGRGRPPGSKTRPREIEVEVISTSRLTDVLQGVSIPFLMQVFKLGRAAVTDRLEPLTPIKHGNNSAPYYSLKDAASYLIEPKMGIDEYLGNLSPADLPDHLSDKVWSAKLKQQRWEENAGELWRTSDVQEVVGELFRTIKERTNLVMDTIDDKSELNIEQRDIFKKVIRGMLEDIRMDLKKASVENRTGSNLKEHEDD